MSGFDNEVVYSTGQRLESSNAQSVFLMQQSGTDVSLINHIGDPEGVLAANPSSLSHDPVSGFIYIKVSGTGTTLWKRIVPGGIVPSIASVDVDAHTAPGTDPVLPTAGGQITVTGGQVAAGVVGTNVIRTDSLLANTYTIEVQRSTSNATTDVTKNGVSHFKSTDFSVDANAFVSLVNPTNPPPNAALVLVDDFVSAVSPAGISHLYLISTCKWSLTGDNTPYILAGTTQDSAHPGVFDTSPTTGAFCMLFEPVGTSDVIPISLGGGVLSCNWVFSINTLSDVTNRYNINIGMGDTTTGSDEDNGVYFRYVDSVNSGKWQIVTANATVLTTTSTATTVTTGWHNAGFVVNAAGTSVEFFMDGVSQGSIATNIPTTPISPTVKHTRISGTAAHSLSIDLMYLNQTLTTPR